MSRQFCPTCGTENPGEARYCMRCGAALGDRQRTRPVPAGAGSAAYSQPGTDWPSIIAAILAFLTLRGMSRQARGVAVVVIFFVLFFGCSTVCALGGFFLEFLTRLFQ